MWPYPEISNVADIVRYNARNYPDKTALLFEDNVTTMAELDALTNQFANALIAAGVKPQDRVVFYGSNSDDFLIALLGTAKASACLVPLNWRLAVDELVVVIGDAEPAFGLVALELEDTWQQVKTKAGFRFAHQGVNPGVISDDPFRTWISDYSSVDPQLPIGSDDNAWILYTSGTTGVPKGVQLSHGGIMNMRLCEHFEAAYTWCETDTFLFVTPNFHLLGIGLTVQAMFNGAAIAVIRAFEPALVLREINAKRPTIMGLAPVMIQMLLSVPEYKNTDFSSIREVVYAGSAISLGLIKQALDVMPCRFMQFYGATESGGAMTLLRPEEHDLTNEHRLTSCGKPLPLMTVKIMDANGVEQPAGSPGEMWMRIPSVAKGYWRKPEVWAQTCVNGWYKTGDVAYQDEEGFLYIVDRVKDMIVTGGENVYCSEVENCLSLHPAIARVAVIGVPSEQWGEAVKACVVLKPDAAATEAELIRYAKDHLAGYKCPKSVDFMTDLPLGGTGKVLKRDLRAPYWQGVQRSVS